MLIQCSRYGLKIRNVSSLSISAGTDGSVTIFNTSFSIFSALGSFNREKALIQEVFKDLTVTTIETEKRENRVCRRTHVTSADP